MSFTRVPGFLPSQSGFHFANNYPKGTSYPVVTLPVIGPINAGDAGNGLCGGFVLAALDLFCHKPRLLPPSNTERPPAGSPIFNYIVGRLMDSFGDPTHNFNAGRVVEWIHTPGHETFIPAVSGLAKRVVADEWPRRIKVDIDSGVPSPLNLVGGPERGLLDVTGHIDTLHHCHQVLAYAYELDDAQNLTLLVYDPNDPTNDDSRISLKIDSDVNHTIPISAPSVNAAMEGGITVRGFFRTAYDLHDPSEIASSHPPSTPTGRFPGAGKDIGIGADGSVWLIGTNPAAGGADLGIYKWNGAYWEVKEGGGVRIAVGPDGQPWLLNTVGEIYQRQGESWVLRPGQGKDISIGADGSVWLIGGNSVGTAADHGICRWTGSEWEGQDGGGVRVAVGPDGQPWLLNSVGEIYHRQGGSWVLQPGRGNEISVGADGSVWLIGTNSVGVAADHGIYRWNGVDWEGRDGGGVRISVGPDGQPWLVNSVDEIYHGV
jgi:hypothetical protein